MDMLMHFTMYCSQGCSPIAISMWCSITLSCTYPIMALVSILMYSMQEHHMGFAALLNAQPKRAWSVRAIKQLPVKQLH